MTLEIVPMTLREARDYVTANHRHHQAPQGGLYYTLQTEPGTSLRAAGFQIVGEVTKRSWDTPSRPRIDKDDRQARFKWEVAA